MTIEHVRTPDERFQNLSDFPYQPNYVELDGLRMHYLDEGPKDAEHVYLCLHGEPSWSYLYRKMIPVFTESGGRVVAPDFFGFGRSDKPVADDVYTFSFHFQSLLSFLDAVKLERFTLVCQDWGGLLGLALPTERPDAIERLIVMNTALATGAAPGPGFLQWRDFVANNPEFNVGRLMKRAIANLSDAEELAYDAHFPDRSFMGGARTFPSIVPIDPEMDGAARSRRAAAWWSGEWSGPSFMAIGAQDPVLGPKVMAALRRVIRGCPEPLVLETAGHFVQEQGEEVARAALAAFS